MSGRSVLVFAYACEPGKGSEPGAGWAWCRLLARNNDVWVVTRANNERTIEAALPSTPEAARLHLVYVDLPRWAVKWKRGQRGVHLYYLLWQVAALRSARRVSTSFDVVWHLTLANAWLGSLAPLVGRRFVLGPVGGGVGPPWGLATALGWRGTGHELVRAAARFTGRYLNPLARIAWARADLILVQNAETRDWLPRRHRAKAEILPNAVLTSSIASRVGARRSVRAAIYAGRLVPWKGLALAVEALAHAQGWRLIVYGGGSDQHRLKRLAQRHSVNDRVEFRGWAERNEIWRAMRADADALLVPSLREDAGWVVMEARAIGLPVICLDRGGPPLLAGSGGIAVSPSRPRATAQRLAEALERSQYIDAASDPTRFAPEAVLRRLDELHRPRAAGEAPVPQVEAGSA